MAVRFPRPGNISEKYKANFSAKRVEFQEMPRVKMEHPSKTSTEKWNI